MMRSSLRSRGAERHPIAPSRRRIVIWVRKFIQRGSADRVVRGVRTPSGPHPSGRGGFNDELRHSDPSEFEQHRDTDVAAGQRRGRQAAALRCGIPHELHVDPCRRARFSRTHRYRTSQSQEAFIGPMAHGYREGDRRASQGDILSARRAIATSILRYSPIHPILDRCRVANAMPMGLCSLSHECILWASIRSFRYDLNDMDAVSVGCFSVSISCNYTLSIL